ncbi:hypothetical protein [Arthrobacter sp. SX1312]|uniref:hypothetical protein n=1 Tax=Arthrobacter sp. SX1312 TaxID=2058896 RepID=UPI0011B0409B|nr:hypothetical protein [Arthrobacter sp. SX1312]
MAIVATAVTGEYHASIVVVLMIACGQALDEFRPHAPRRSYGHCSSGHPARLTQALEQLARARSVAFDTTGTLTSVTPLVGGIVLAPTAGPLTEDEVLAPRSRGPRSPSANAASWKASSGASLTLPWHRGKPPSTWGRRDRRRPANRRR